MEAHQHESESESKFSKGYFETLLWKMHLLAKPFLESFEKRSEPACVYQEDLEPLKRRLARIKATLKDYYENWVPVGEESHKLRLAELRDLEYRAEDIIEVLEFESQRTTKLEEFKRKLRSNRMSNKRRREEQEVGIFFSSPPVRSLGSKIKEIWKLFHEITFDWDALRWREGDGERCQRCCSLRPPTTSLMSEAFHGRTDDVQRVIELLISDEGPCEGNISVIPIYGMGGVGKTCLAQRVFGDKDVKSHFDTRIWICISEPFDAVKVTKAILEELRMETSCPSELNRLQQDVMIQLKDKRFLLVLDDLWNDKHWEKHWSIILDPLRVGADGSKIIVTTRNSRVAKFMGPLTSHRLSCMDEDDCWSIFHQHAFGCRYPSADPNLTRIGKEINQKCRGLPLAAKVLGCLLQTELNEEHWRRVLEDLWNHEECENGILPDLRLSFDHLPMQLKCCFLYCSLFPKGHMFKKDQLSKLWMAEGFLESDGRSELKETGSKYFDELVDRSFFQHSPFYDRSEQKYLMHDLFDELAQSISGLEYKRMEYGMPYEMQKKTRHSSIVLDQCHLEKLYRFEVTDVLDLRTLLFIRRHEHFKTSFHVEIPRFLPLHCFRVLDLSYTDIKELPVSVGHLIHLRYLGLRNTKIRRLPESICGLFKLQTLDLKKCHELQQLPEGVNLLSDLQLLQLPSQCRTNIQTLSAVIEYDEPESEVDRIIECDAPLNVVGGQKAMEEILTAEPKKDVINGLIELDEPRSVFDRQTAMDENVLIDNLVMCNEPAKVDDGLNAREGTHLETASKIAGVDWISVDTKEKSPSLLTVAGDVDAVSLVSQLRSSSAEVVSIGPAKEPERKGEKMKDYLKGMEIDDGEPTYSFSKRDFPGNQLEEECQKFVRCSTKARMGNPVDDFIAGQEVNSEMPLQGKKGIGRKTVRVMTIMENSLDDGYTWKMYNQENVLGLEFPRSYYLCANTLHGCRAKKTVQQLDGDSHTIEVSYLGDHSHTCQPSRKATISEAAQLDHPQSQPEVIEDN